MWKLGLSSALRRDDRTSRTSFLFRVVYQTLYFLLHLLLLALLLVTPGDLITQAVQNGNLYSMLIISIGYVLTILLVLFVYLTRLYLNRSALSSIPKQWIPIEKGEVGKRVHTMIQRYLSRSAAIAYDARPRIKPAAPPGSMENQQEDGQEQGGKRSSFHMLRLKKTATLEEEMGISLPPHRPVWGEIEHPGWASPNSPDLPNLQYNTVILELPNLIEAKALTLAPPDPRSATNPPMLDAQAVELLQRPPNAGLRDYLAHLNELGVLTPSPATSAFITMYEHARFSPRPISMARFRDLMHNFAEVLRRMDRMDQQVFNPKDDNRDERDADADDNNSTPASDSDIDNDGPVGTDPTTPRSQLSKRSRDGQGRDSSPTASSDRSSRSQIRKGKRPALPGRNSSANTWQAYRTAPTTPKSRRTVVSQSSPSSSADSFAQTRRPYPVSQPSSASLRSAATGASGASGASQSSRATGASGGSVIRLADGRDATDLPYVLLHANTS